MQRPWGKCQKILLLGSGELGKELVIAAQRWGFYVVAVDRYVGAPAMAVADEFAVVNMLDAKALRKCIEQHRPDYIVPEIEAIRTTELLKLEQAGHRVVPSAHALHLTMHRDAIRNLAAHELGLKTARFAYASSLEELLAQAPLIGFPQVVKPIMSSSGKGQSVVRSAKELTKAWATALKGMRGDDPRVIIEEFIHFESEITLLTIQQQRGPTLFCPPIGHVQERGDYQESWAPAQIEPALLRRAQGMAKKVTQALGGAGLFGVEFFLTKDEVYFSELSPRPHDTGLVTLAAFNMSEFELHLRAFTGLPIAPIRLKSPAASRVILGPDREITAPHFVNIEPCLQDERTQLLLFGKPRSYKNRRLGVVLAQDTTTNRARKRATTAARLVKIKG